MESSGTCRELRPALAPPVLDNAHSPGEPRTFGWQKRLRRAGLVLPTVAFREGVVEMEPLFWGTQKDRMSHNRCCPTKCQGEHSHSEGSRTPEAMGTSDQHLQTHLAGPTPGSAHVRRPKEKASSMKTLNTGALAHQKPGVKTGAVMQGTSSASISSPNENELGQEQQQQHSQKSHNPSQKVGEFPQEQQLPASPGRRQEGGLQGCSCKDLLTLQGTGKRHLHALTPLPYVLGTSAHSRKKFNNTSFQVKYFYYQNYYISCESSNVTAWCKNSTRVRSYSPHLS